MKKIHFSNASLQPSLSNASDMTASQQGQSLYWDELLTTSELPNDTENPFLCKKTHTSI